MPSVKDIIVQALNAAQCNALYDEEDGCFCTLDNLFEHCGSPHTRCVIGTKSLRTPREDDPSSDTDLLLRKLEKQCVSG